MKISCLFAVLSTTSLVSASIVRREAATLLNDIANIKNGSAIVYQDILAYDNTTNSAIKIYSDSNNLDAVIKNSTTDAMNSAALSDADSASIANAVVDLQPQVFQTLQALVDRKQGFTNATLGFSAIGLVYGSVTNLRADTAYFGGNLTNKLSTTFKRLSPLLTSNIDFHFARAQQAFSTGY